MITVSNQSHWIIQQAEQNPDKKFIVTPTQKFSFSETLEKAFVIYNYCKKNGFDKNSRIGVLSSHNADFIFTILGLWLSECTPVLINKSQTDLEIEEQKKTARVSDLIDPSNFDFAVKIKTKKSSLNFLPDDFALIIFTSGTTGKTKAVVHTFSSLYQSIKNCDSFINHNSEDIWLASLPFFHIGGFAIFLRALICGCQITIPKSLLTEDLTHSVKTNSPTFASFVTTTFYRLIEKNISPWKNLRILFLGGGPLNQNKIFDFVNSGWPIAKVYGSSETCAMITAEMASKYNRAENLCGKQLGDVEIKIDNQQNITVKTKALFAGYFQSNSLDDSKIKNHFYSTGDIGELKSNHLNIFSRRSDLIISGGKNIDPLEIENIIRANFDVKDVKVFALEDTQWGQQVTAAIIPNGNQIAYDNFKTQLKKNLSGYKIPKQIFYVEKFPETATGKIDLQKLKKILQSG